MRNRKVDHDTSRLPFIPVRDKKEWMVAIHEAGHAVMGILCGRSVSRIDLIKGPTRLGAAYVLDYNDRYMGDRSTFAEGDIVWETTLKPIMRVTHTDRDKVHTEWTDENGMYRTASFKESSLNHENAIVLRDNKKADVRSVHGPAEEWQSLYEACVDVAGEAAEAVYNDRDCYDAMTQMSAGFGNGTDYNRAFKRVHGYQLPHEQRMQVQQNLKRVPSNQTNQYMVWNIMDGVCEWLSSDPAIMEAIIRLAKVLLVQKEVRCMHIEAIAQLEPNARYMREMVEFARRAAMQQKYTREMSNIRSLDWSIG